MSDQDLKSSLQPDAPKKQPTPVEHEHPAVQEDAGAQALAEALSSSFKIVKVLMFGLIAVFIASGVFTVNSNEEAVVLRFGKPTSAETLKPGLHWAFPRPIDEIVLIPVRQSHSVRSTTGWYFMTPEQEALGQVPFGTATMQPGIDGYTLTGDGNIIHVRATVKYQIDDPLDYAFHFNDITNSLVNAIDNAIFYASTRFTAEDLIYKDRLTFKDEVIRKINSNIEKWNLGIRVETTEVEAQPPIIVAEAFEQVQSAEQEKSKRISAAEGYLNEIQNTSEGEAYEILQAGISASNQVYQTVVADVNYFQAQLPRFKQNPKLFKQRLRVDMMERVLTNSQDKWFIPSSLDGTTQELRLQLSREPQKAKTQQTTP